MKSDADIQRDVMEELSWEPFLRASEIGVAVKNGIVTLSGTVDAYAKKVTAETAAKRIEGVRAVAEDINVTPGPEQGHADSDIAEAVANLLKWRSATERNNIKIVVEHGWVTLSGEVDWDFQRQSVRMAVEGMKGITGLSNNIVIHAYTPVDIRKKITAAYQRHASLCANQIGIDVSGNTVTLNGTVNSYSEKTEAEKAAWLAPGITEVVNKLELKAQVPTS